MNEQELAEISILKGEKLEVYDASPKNFSLWCIKSPTITDIRRNEQEIIESRGEYSLIDITVGESNGLKSYIFARTNCCLWCSNSENFKSRIYLVVAMLLVIILIISLITLI